ncbi:MAG: FAD synthetase family protein [Puniceicoccales bacterium]|nr:FAD synthetase family protein [Puniceicoccales bacterium]
MSIGTFDGVHIGHRKLISAAIDRARESDGIAAVYTFYPHPTAVTDPQNAKSMLCSRDEKYKMLVACGVDFIVEQKFDPVFAAAEPCEFIAFLAHKFPTLRGIFVGEDFKFGRNRSGDANALLLQCQKFGISVAIVPPLAMDGERVSSSRIRKLMGDGNVARANLMLGG